MLSGVASAIAAGVADIVVPPATQVPTGKVDYGDRYAGELVAGNKWDR